MREVRIGFLEKPNVNRGLFFGENIFTSFSSYNLQVPFLGEHIQRLKNGLSFFYKNLDTQEVLGKAEDQVRLTLKEFGSDLYFRLTPLVSLCTTQLAIQINFKEKDHSETVLKDVVTSKGNWYFSKLNNQTKVGQYSEDFLRLAELKSMGYVDFIKVGLSNEVIEASTSNIFFVKDNKVIIPVSENNFLEGLVIKKLKGERRKVLQGELSAFDHCFFTNSVDYIVPIVSIDGRKMKPMGRMSKKDLLCKYLPGVFEV